ncbi:conserved hypothetical protein [Klebsiella quasipneumoniae subsp. quasipneumoniae]|nr:conserved hypothetical protein [Klebsiella quasipneumoniae subsp. quasipneumoniae]
MQRQSPGPRRPPPQEQFYVVSETLFTSSSFSPVFFNFEVQIRQVCQQAKYQTSQNTNSGPLGWGYFVEQLQHPEPRVTCGRSVGNTCC